MIYIFIQSYLRPVELARLLGSLQTTREAYPVKIAVREEGVVFPPFEVHWRNDPSLDYHVSTPENHGIAGSWQKLVDHYFHSLFPDDILVFLDDDAYVKDPSWLPDLIGPIQRGEAEITGIDAWKLLPSWLSRPAVEGEEPDYVANGRCAILADLFLSGLAFDTRYFRGYEDVDFCFQAIARGYRIAWVAAPALVHEAHDVTASTIEYVRQSWRLFIEKWGLVEGT